MATDQVRSYGAYCGGRQNCCLRVSGSRGIALASGC